MQHKRSRRVGHVLMACLAISFVFALSGCGGSQQSQQQASQAKASLDSILKQASQVGVPATLLQPVQRQEQQLSSASAPFTLFNDSPATQFYLNQAKQYQQLSVQAQGIIDTTTQLDSSEAQASMQHFQADLSSAQSLKAGNLQAFSQQYASDQQLLANAKYPKDFAAVNTDASKATQALDLLKSTHAILVNFNTTIQQMQSVHLDVSQMQAQYSGDLATLNTITNPVDFQNLQALINTQYQMAVDNSIQALPFVGNAKLNEFKQQIALLKTYGMDTSPYLPLYNADVKQMQAAKTIDAYLAVSQKIDTDIATMQGVLAQGASTYLITELNNEALAWGQAHLFHDKFDGNNYILDAGYTMAGIGYWLQQELGYADTQTVVADENNELFDLHMLEQDYSDPTPYNKVHQTDLQVMQHYPSLQHGTVLMVSLVEEAMRVYQNGKLINAFYVTTGRVELPSLPGYWTVQDRASPTKFTSSDPPGSPYWYPPTPINYAILYHSDGYFVHDAWWRVNFGPGTQFPHYDVGGDESFAGNGSHGCINMQESQAAWVYANTDYNTQIMVY